MYTYQFEFSIPHRFAITKHSLEPLSTEQLQAAADKMIADQQAMEWAEIQATTDGKLILGDKYVFEQVNQTYTQPEYPDTQPLVR